MVHVLRSCLQLFLPPRAQANRSFFRWVYLQVPRAETPKPISKALTQGEAPVVGACHISYRGQAYAITCVMCAKASRDGGTSRGSIGQYITYSHYAAYIIYFDMIKGI